MTWRLHKHSNWQLEGLAAKCSSERWAEGGDLPAENIGRLWLVCGGDLLRQDLDKSEVEDIE
jgi:hypothetical protein